MNVQCRPFSSPETLGLICNYAENKHGDSWLIADRKGVFNESLAWVLLINVNTPETLYKMQPEGRGYILAYAIEKCSGVDNGR